MTELYEIILFLIFCIIQSVFGVGLLLFGTPTFLMLGYNYFEVLNILLPYSFIISFFQIIYGKAYSDIKYIKNFIFYCLPTLLLGLILINIINEKINFKVLISTCLIILAITNIFNFNIKKLNFIYFKTSLFIIGFIHGLTNLGGSFLAIALSNKNINKIEIRNKIALSYLIFAFVQYSWLYINHKKLILIKFEYIILTILVFYISNLIFKKFENLNFKFLLNYFILIFGIYLLIINII